MGEEIVSDILYLYHISFLYSSSLLLSNELPVLLALAHQENITQKANFMKVGMELRLLLDHIKLDSHGLVSTGMTY